MNSPQIKYLSHCDIIFFMKKLFVVFFIKYCLHIAIFHIGQYDMISASLQWLIPLTRPVYSHCKRQWPFFSLFFSVFAVSSSLHRCAADENRWLENLELSLLCRSTHTIFHFFFHALPCAACIECRFQMLARDFASVNSRSWLMADLL